MSFPPTTIFEYPSTPLKTLSTPTDLVGTSGLTEVNDGPQDIPHCLNHVFQSNSAA